VKVISWIPDFQYRHLPDMFPGLDAARETAINRSIATHCDAVVVSSEHALRDLLEVVPRELLPPVQVLRFVSQPFVSSGRDRPSLSKIQQDYGISGRYFLLPNQFWAHKNHDVVLRALAAAKRSGMSITVLMTGNTRDYRLTGDQYVNRLKDLIRDLDIESEARILGLIPYEDLLELMRHCVAVINPSRFEGWSSSVEEARSMGRPVLMSRIPVHLEQAPPLGAYFDCDDAAGLWKLMQELLSRCDGDDVGGLEIEANADLIRRTEEFGQNYLQLVRRLLAGS
jgi:glycosyltransferase involved in cell wall biosynthesis